eukprot:CAMPEP_0174913306 /NCGR_PEP_ID=MMETSP0167-20121228/80251_1 /TAXON_ID=38298 /ORGANISM="Rhodella maculata, Strain CCMP736" /LENGTH=64 /DNA_ID=CAMNT_0016158021 /DNA_START=1129 /DNA_END=1319 /DNA_ORIENTATION=+
MTRCSSFGGAKNVAWTPPSLSCDVQRVPSAGSFAAGTALAMWMKTRVVGEEDAGGAGGGGGGGG